MDEQLPIVIGNDGSDFADAALQKGLWLAQQLKAPVRVIRAWTISTAPRPASWTPGYVPPPEDFEAEVLRRLTKEVEPFTAEYPDVQVSLEAPHGPAGRELLRASEGARLLVVGTRGLGGFKGLLMGSVSDQVVEHARCDVLVVRQGAQENSPDRRLPLDRMFDS